MITKCTVSIDEMVPSRNGRDNIMKLSPEETTQATEAFSVLEKEISDMKRIVLMGALPLVYAINSIKFTVDAQLDIAKKRR